MPTYTFKNIKTNEVFDEFMPMAELDEFKSSHPELQQVITSAKIVRSVMSPRNKPDKGFREVLRKIKKGSPRSNINTFE